MIRTKIKLIVVFLFCALPGQAHGNDIAYSITDLGVLDGPSSYALGMNDLGEVVGYADIYTRYSHAFLYNGSGPLINLGSFGGDYSVSVATAINNSGMVVGYSDTGAGGTPQHAFLYTSGGPRRDLGTLGGPVSEALDINNSGQIAGWAQTANGSYDGFLCSENTPMVDLGPYQAMLINDARQVVAVNGTANYLRTFISSGGTGAWVDIGSLGGTRTVPYGMNSRGEIVGMSSFSGSGTYPSHAFLYSGSTMTDLGTFGGQDSSANGINDLGVVVGGAQGPDDLYGHAFVYYGSGTIEDLNDLVDPSLGWAIGNAEAINDRGQILAEAYQQYGELRAVVLTPIPEPSSFYLLIATSCGCAALNRFLRVNARSNTLSTPPYAIEPGEIP